MRGPLQQRGGWLLALSDARPGSAFDHADELVAPVAMGAGEFDEFVDLTQYRSALRCAGDGDAASAPEFEEAFVPQGAQRAQDRVRVDTEDLCEILRERETVAWSGFPLGDRAADLGGYLKVERCRLGWVNFTLQHGVC